jgi:phosphatidylglycerol:prolipoprotein diacylglycerol transferase
MADIRFPNLGIEIEHLQNSISIPFLGGFEIRFYGIIIGIGVIVGYLVACHCARKEKIKSETLMDFLIYALIFSIIGARTYYVVFSWDNYKNNLLQVFNLRGGGLAIYGGVIAAVLTLFVYTRIKKISFVKMADCCVPGLMAGQIIGRWGNFFNCEAFGGYSDGLFAMQIRENLVYSNYITQDLQEHIVTDSGARYIQVHPTFLYESVWTLVALSVLLTVYRYKKFDGQICLMYFIAYGLGRFWIEGLRTDQLLIPCLGIAVSQVLSAVLVLVGVVLLCFGFRKQKLKTF